MGTYNLINADRAKFNIKQTTFTTAENQTIDALIAACSEAFSRFCGRTFQVAQHDELISGNLEERIKLRNFPLLSVDRVATGLTTLLEIQNTSWPTNNRATVQVLKTGLKLVKVASGVITDDVTVTWTANVTVNAVKSAVNLLGSGWDASVPDSNYGTWASEDFRYPQGALSAANSTKVPLKVHIEEEDEYDVEEKDGFLLKSSGWARGINNWRVIYTAGFEEIPQDLQEACAIMVAGAFNQTKRDPMSASTKTADFSYNASQMFAMPWPQNVLRILASYKPHRV